MGVTTNGRCQPMIAKKRPGVSPTPGHVCTAEGQKPLVWSPQRPRAVPAVIRG